jgi:hypothetical protein
LTPTASVAPFVAETDPFNEARSVFSLGFWPCSAEKAGVMCPSPIPATRAPDPLSVPDTPPLRVCELISACQYSPPTSSSALGNRSTGAAEPGVITALTLDESCSTRPSARVTS